MKYSKNNMIIKSHGYVQIRRNAAQYLSSLYMHSDLLLRVVRQLQYQTPKPTADL